VLVLAVAAFFSPLFEEKERKEPAAAAAAALSKRKGEKNSFQQDRQL
jgi:hypothetical protein